MWTCVSGAIHLPKSGSVCRSMRRRMGEIASDLERELGSRELPAPFIHELRVRYGECDPQGIVFNANYLLYLDVAFTELWRNAVGPWHEMVERGVDAVV